jgi:hypothetical protein
VAVLDTHDRTAHAAPDDVAVNPEEAGGEGRGHRRGNGRRPLRPVGLALLVAGGAAQVTGASLDAWLHLRDPSLAHHEAVFSFANPGHGLLAAGLGTLVLGGFVWVAGPRLDRAPSRPGRLGPPAAVVAALVVLGLLAARSNLGRSQVVDVTASDGHAHSSPAASAAATGPVVDGHSHGGPLGGGAPVDAATQALLTVQLAQTRAAALRYPTLADARAGGYTQAAGYFRGIGAHYMRYALVGQDFDPANPQMLLYDGDDAGSHVVGVMYYLYSSGGPPEGFAGPFDVWHQHPETCVGPTGAHFSGDPEGAAECGHKGRNAWMLHAWVVPGWDSIEGVFSAANSRLP